MDKTRTFLIVDADRHTRRSLNRMLWLKTNQAIVCVLEAENCTDACAIIESQPIDCMIFDNFMPTNQREDWLGRFLALRPEMAIVVLAGAGDEASAVAAMKAGACDYAIKGAISADALMRMIASSLERTALRRAVAMQQAKLVDAERQRVMIESLGAVCHHMGQPITVITTCLDLIRRQAAGDALSGIVEQCRTAAEEVNARLGKLQNVSFYRSEP